MNVRTIMTHATETVGPATPIRDVANRMKKHDIGFVPVCEGDRLMGTVTDRDIAIRVVAEGKSASTPAADVMTPGVECCYADEDVEQAARIMADRQVRRLVVVDRDDHRIVGVISLGDLSTRMNKEETVAKTLEAVSEPMASLA
jgi:CBS domain-containing protein